MLTYRPADLKGDYAFGRDVHHRAYRDVVVRQFGSWNEEMQNKFFEDAWKRLPHQIILHDSTPVGVVSIGMVGHDLFIHELQILPEHQGHGLGTAVLAHQIEIAQRAQLKIKLKVLKENRAQYLYRRMGFVTSGEDATHLLMEWQEGCST